LDYFHEAASKRSSVWSNIVRIFITNRFLSLSHCHEGRIDVEMRKKISPLDLTTNENVSTKLSSLNAMRLLVIYILDEVTWKNKLQINVLCEDESWWRVVMEMIMKRFEILHAILR
jgi:hypothetical protein